MKQGMLALVLGTLAVTAAPAASARVNFNVGIGVDPYGYGAYAPPVVYQPDPYYVAPPVVYVGGGYWGGDHRHGRGHRHR